jgi:hypothetical protein
MTAIMDPTTELASDFTVARYRELRPHLTNTPPCEESWREVINAIQRRIQERFLTPSPSLRASMTRTSSRTVRGLRSSRSTACSSTPSNHSVKEG